MTLDTDLYVQIDDHSNCRTNNSISLITEKGTQNNAGIDLESFPIRGHLTHIPWVSEDFLKIGKFFNKQDR